MDKFGFFPSNTFRKLIAQNEVHDTPYTAHITADGDSSNADRTSMRVVVDIEGELMRLVSIEELPESFAAFKERALGVHNDDVPALAATIASIPEDASADEDGEGEDAGAGGVGEPLPVKPGRKAAN